MDRAWSEAEPVDREPAGNGRTPICSSTQDGAMVAAPRCPHLVHRKFRRRTSLEVSGPHLIANGTNGIGRR
jgi:hypothetical protein